MFSLLPEALRLLENWFQEIYLGPFIFFFFFSHNWVGKMHICIEIIFSELSLQVCQIYKHHDYKDIFLDLGFLLGLFLLSFVMFWVTLTWIYWVGNFVFWAISWPRLCFCVYIKASHQIFFSISEFTGSFWWRHSVWSVSLFHLPLLPPPAWPRIPRWRWWALTAGRGEQRPDGFTSHLRECQGSERTPRLMARMGLPSSVGFALTGAAFCLTELSG